MNQQQYDNMTPTFIDCDYMSKTDHQLALGYIAGDIEQLVSELYDSCEAVDRDIVHELICDIYERLDMDEIPDIKKLKIKTKGK